jgi:hypothetical protein
VIYVRVSAAPVAAIDPIPPCGWCCSSGDASDAYGENVAVAA